MCHLLNLDASSSLVCSQVCNVACYAHSWDNRKLLVSKDIVMYSAQCCLPRSLFFSSSVAYFVLSPSAVYFINAIQAVLAKHELVKGCIFHSDRGSQYTSKAVMELLKRYGFCQSFSRVGMPGDNAWSESFFVTMKKELLLRSLEIEKLEKAA